MQRGSTSAVELRRIYLRIASVVRAEVCEFSAQ